VLDNDESFVVAFQRQQLLDIRSLFDDLDLDLGQLLEQEARTSEGASALQGEVEAVKAELAEMGVEAKKSPSPTANVPEETPGAEYRYRRLEVIKADEFEDLSAKAKDYLSRNGIDLGKDPILQVLTADEIKEAADVYRQKYGDIAWSKTDYLVVMIAGVAATLVDIFLTGLPPNPTAGKDPERLVSPVTSKIREKTDKVYGNHPEFFKQLEEKAPVPFDARYSKDVGEQVDGLRPKLHRLMSLGHDPGLLIIGILDIMSGKGRYIDEHGNIIVALKEGYEPVDFIEAFNRVFLHLLSDVFTPMGIQPPFFSLAQLVPGTSPFEIRGDPGVQVSWTDLARYMYANGYDFRHFISMGLVPATVELIVWGYWLYYSFDNEDQAEKERLKLASMLLLGHLLAATGNVVKIGIVSSMVGPESAPLAVNWAELLALVPVVVAFYAESLRRDNRIRNGLDSEWLSIYEKAHLTG